MCLRRVATLAALLCAAAIAAGCGGGSRSLAVLGVADHPAPPASDFPKAGRPLSEVLKVAKGHQNLGVTTETSVLGTGRNRYAFGLFNAAGQQVPNARVALYIAREQGPSRGPFTARVESLKTMRQFRSRTTIQDPNAAAVVYVAHLDFPSAGEWRVIALIRRGHRVDSATLPNAEVGALSDVPAVGQRPPRIHTPTAASVHGHLERLTTRVPPDTMNKVDFYNVLGKKPIVLLFATPRFSQDREDGPIVDIAQQVQRQFAGKAEFIHMELFNNNRPKDGVRPQVRAFNLPTEPWLFVMDRSGLIRTRIEGAFNSQELSNAVKAVTGP